VRGILRGVEYKQMEDGSLNVWQLRGVVASRHGGAVARKIALQRGGPYWSHQAIAEAVARKYGIEWRRYVLAKDGNQLGAR
jgi:hypothetical protein